jgi:hypothetical protein
MTRTFEVKTERLDACPHCHSRRLKRWCTGRDRLYRLSTQEFTYSKCADCALVFLSVRPTADEAHKFYPENYGPYKPTYLTASPSSSNGHVPLGRRAAHSLKRLLDFVGKRTEGLLPDEAEAKNEKYYRPPFAGAQLLDFGCGSDMFLNWARERGWQTVGLDFSESVVRRVAASGHRALLMGPRVWDEIEDESLDFVRLSHVLEHLYEPHEVLGRLREKMKTGATIHISVPNPSCLTSRVFGARWFSLDCPRHVILYSPDVLRRVLEDVGFAEHEFAHDIITKDFARSLGYLMCERGWMAREGIDGMQHRPVLTSALNLPAKLAAKLGVADRYHVFARKSAQRAPAVS